MNCTNCGIEVPDEAQTCPACGADLTPSPTAEQQSQPSPNKAKRIAIIVVAAVVLIALIAGIVFWQASVRKAGKAAHSQHTVVLSIVAAGYDDATATRFPVQIDGEDLDGDAVSEVQFANIDGSGVELRQGEYTLTLPAGPMDENGTLWLAPETQIEVTVPAGLSEDATWSGNTGTLIVYAEADVMQITDDQIELAKTYAAQDSERAERANTCADAVKAARDSATQSASDEQNAKEEAAKKAAEETAAAEQAADEAAKKAAEEANTNAANLKAAISKIGGWWQSQDEDGAYLLHIDDTTAYCYSITPAQDEDGNEISLFDSEGLSEATISLRKKAALSVSKGTDGDTTYYSVKGIESYEYRWYANNADYLTPKDTGSDTRSYKRLTDVPNSILTQAKKLEK